MNSKIKVVVCGSTFGQLYLKALQDRSDLFQIVGLFGTGSERSKKCAKEYGITLYTDIEKIPKETDLACIAVKTAAFGGKGTDIALALLDKGIHVIQEHPSHPKDMEQCYRIARKKNLVYHIGNLYPYLEDVKQFIKCANYLNDNDELLHIDVMFSGQLSYPLIKILQLAMPSIQKWEMEKQEKTDGKFQLLCGRLGDIPICMQINNEVVPDDPNNYMHILHRITFFYSSGHLTLEDTFGPLIWHPRMFIPINTALNGTLNMECPENVYQNSGYILSNANQNKSFEKILTAVWPQTIQHDLMKVYNQIQERRVDVIVNQKELLCARQWNQITKDFGYPKVVSNQIIVPVSFEELKKNCIDECGGQNV